MSSRGLYIGKILDDLEAIGGQVLDAWGFAKFEQDESHKSGWFDFGFPGAEGSSLSNCFFNFLSEQGLSAASLFSTMNFTAFGPRPVAETDPPMKPKLPKISKK